MSRSGESASPGVSSPGLAFLAVALGGILPFALAKGGGMTCLRFGFPTVAEVFAATLAVTFGTGLVLAFAWVFAAGLTAAADLADGLALATGLRTATGRAGACFFTGFACFLVAVFVAT